MRCPWYLFHRLFLVWARTQGPHDPLLPGGPMSCQSAPAWELLLSCISLVQDGALVSIRGAGRDAAHRRLFECAFSVAKDTGAP
ncbi:unnamed protein product [Staurois parvus]|uniref:Secreted protein n=1 Tax=Staurois parvus TaxID=386267 RepID=A0ABN9EVC6_9NEOB|nr:unnamed protein product [Staurois parvus]